MASGAEGQFVGPHEGRELSLMKSGTKPLSMFVAPMDLEHEPFPEGEFDELVSRRLLIKEVSVEAMRSPDGKTQQIRRILYAIPNEEWRISAMLLVHELYETLLPGWRPDLERLIGLLLGYKRDDIERFIAMHVQRSASASARSDEFDPRVMCHPRA